MRSLKQILAIPATVAIVGASAATGCESNDTKLNDEVKARVEATSPNAGVTIRTKDRIVTLQGVVQTPAERTGIEDTIRRVDGVLGVDNQLGVASPTETTGAPYPR